MVELLPWPPLAVIALSRVLLAVVLLAVGLPWLMFPRPVDRESSPWVTRAIWMAFIATVTVHCVAAVGLYEASFFLAICAAVTLWTRVLALPPTERLAMRVRLVGRLYDLFDGRRALRSTAPAEQAPAGRAAPAQPRLVSRLPIWTAIGYLLLLVALALSARLLFTEAFTTPAPAFSDAPVNIAWLKYMESNQLYHDGLYPLGMYAALSLLRKFTTLNAVVLLDVAGPLIGLAILLSVLFFVYKSTRSLGAVLIAALLYGVLPQLLPLDLERHAGHQSEEYGLIFVLPSAWYCFSHLTRGHPPDRATAAAAAGVATFSHPLAAVFAIAAMAAACAVGLVGGGTAAWRRLPGLVGWVGGAGIIACLPLAVGLVAGRPWHGSSLAYAQSAGQVLADRGKEFIALGITVAAAFTWSLAERLLGRLRPTAVLAALLVAVLAWRASPPAPARPYHYFTDEMIEVYLRADASYVSGTWTLVTGFRGYSLALGRALHMYPDEFVDMARQMPADFSDWYDAPWSTPSGKWVTDPKTPHFLLLVERTSPLAPGQAASEAAPVLAQAASLADWIAEARAGLPLRHVFGNENIDAWLLDLPVPKRPAGLMLATARARVHSGGKHGEASDRHSGVQ